MMVQSFVAAFAKAARVSDVPEEAIMSDTREPSYMFQAATQASHWSLVGSFHQGMLCTVSIAAMVFLPRSEAALSMEPCVQGKGYPFSRQSP
jgi:hypothetical protein